MNSDSTQERKIAERSAKRFWCSFVVLLLGLQVVIGFSAVKLALGDPTVAVVPDYHTAALNWDQSKARAARFDKLGWNLHLQASTPSAIADSIVQQDTKSDRSHFTIQVNDRAGNPVSGLAMNMEAFHHARGSEVFSFQPDEVSNGCYLMNGFSPRNGIWEIKISIEYHGETITTARVMEID